MITISSLQHFIELKKARIRAIDNMLDNTSSWNQLSLILETERTTLSIVVADLERLILQ